MNKQFSDEQLDQILSKIVKDSALSESEIKEIADSPNLWWNVQKNIKENKETRRKGWIPPWFDWRIAAFASMIFVVCAGFILFANSRNEEISADVKNLEITFPFAPKIDVVESPQKEKFVETEVESKISRKKVISTKNNSNLTASTKPVNHSINPSQKMKVQTKAEEIKTDFIALNYSPAAESGQILKVKVPRSMMVSLGVTQKIENSSELVNAEVLMGDDGLARAIRFIQ